MVGSRARLGLLGAGAALVLGLMVVLLLVVPAEEVTLFGGAVQRTPGPSALAGGPSGGGVAGVRAWGYNRYGQIGDGTASTARSPVAVGLAAIAVAAGDGFSVALLSDGTIRTWGYNNSGQLGDGTTIDRSSPVKPALSDVTAIAAGAAHGLALKSDGTVVAWGQNKYGHLGDGTTTSRSSPVSARLAGVKITAIAAGRDHSLALGNDGRAYAWGRNTEGQLGDGTTTHRSSAVPVLAASNIPIPWILTDLTAIAAGRDHSLALKSDGTVVAWGNNAHGQLGDGTTTNRSEAVPVFDLSGVTAIAAGGSHGLAVASTGSAWGWGDNSAGQLGDGTETTERTTPQRVAGLTDVHKVAAGDLHSLALKSDGTVWGWGGNFSGQLGDAAATRQRSPAQVSGLSSGTAIAAGDDHSLAVAR